jgi:hypothetical protein
MKPTDIIGKDFDETLREKIETHVMNIGYDAFNVVIENGLLSFTNPGRFNVQVINNKVRRYWAG